MISCDFYLLPDGGGVRRDYLTDTLGSVTAAVNSSGAIENTSRCKPYGDMLSKTGDTGSRNTGKKAAEQYNQARHYGTKSYCNQAKNLGHKNYGYNCFCKVSSMICNYINAQCNALPPALREAYSICKPWAECINKCLYDCIASRKVCSASANKCWDRAFRPPDPLFRDKGSPCMQIWSGCIRWDG